MNFKYPKSERLKSKTTIGRLFSEGRSVSKYPLRLVYVAVSDAAPFQVGVSVSKKYFKKAVDRNYFKRVLRETYRLNQHMLKDAVNSPVALMLFYQSKDKLSFEEINRKTIQLFEKFIADINIRSNT